MLLPINLSDNEGGAFTGMLPTSWDDVPLLKYGALAAAQNLNERAIAYAALLGLPAEPLVEDVSVYAYLRKAGAFLFDGPLPETPEALPSFTHAGITYQYIGDLQKMNGGQYEALTGLLDHMKASGADPLTKTHELLAVLYVPQGQEQNAATVDAAATAFQTLPMSIGYPAVQAFFLRNWKSAQPIRTFSAVQAEVQQTLATVEQAISASQASSWNLLRWLSLMWIRRVKKTLSAASIPSNITAHSVPSSGTPTPKASA
jgi:hypothetical protein